MLVFCVGMFRACSTWQYGVVAALLERHRGGKRIGFVDGERFSSEVGPTLDPSGWYVLKSHDAHEQFAEALAGGRAVAITSHRDLRDVAFSWMHKTGASFDDVLDRSFLERCLRNDRSWSALPGALIQAYADLIADPARGVAEIAEHLGIGLEPGEARAIADSLSWEANRQRTTELAGRLRAEGVTPRSDDQERYDPATLLHWNHLRDGGSGTWRDIASDEQLGHLARICGPWLVEKGYEPDNDWAGPALAEPPPRVSFAQNGEDILLDRLFRGRTGTFLDIGANHPTRNNNTYFFYLRGWRGVNVEPVRSAIALFDDRRPRDLNLALAVSDTEGSLPFYEVLGCDSLSTLSGELAEEQKARGFPVVERRVPTRTVAGLVERHGLLPPDFVSIDVEGNEERVLRGIPLATWRPKMFVIEATRPMTNTLCHHPWEPILLEQGYLFAAFDGINRYYLRDDLSGSLPLFEAPVNSLDFHERFETFEQRSRADALQHRLEEERLRAEQARAELAHERGSLADSKARLVAERGARQGERDAWQQERDAWQSERDAWQSERDAGQQERDTGQRERDAWQQERDAVQRERDSWQQERDAGQRERDAIQRERDSVQRERDSWHAERVEALDHRQSCQAERLRFEQDRARWEDERAASRDAVDEARSLLRPYRMIDRLGVVNAIHRRVRGHGKHSRT